jgi:hypothetical protein
LLRSGGSSTQFSEGVFVRMKKIKKASRAKATARTTESTNENEITAAPTDLNSLKWMTSAPAIVLGMTFVVVTAALLTAREDQAPAQVERLDLSPVAATVQTNIARPAEAKKAVIAKTSPPAPAPPAAASTNLVVASQPESVPSVTITGCLDNEDGTFRLTDASGVDAPTARSWKSGFLKKRAAQIEIVDAAGTLNLRRFAGRRVGVTGTLVDRDMRARSVRLIGPCE